MRREKIEMREYIFFINIIKEGKSSIEMRKVDWKNKSQKGKRLRAGESSIKRKWNMITTDWKNS